MNPRKLVALAAGCVAAASATAQSAGQQRTVYEVVPGRDIFALCNSATADCEVFEVSADVGALLRKNAAPAPAAGAVAQQAAVAQPRPAVPAPGPGPTVAAPAAPTAGASNPGANAAAQAPAASTLTKDAFQKVADLTQIDTSVPSSPAFNVLGIAPEKVDRPGAPRDFVTALAKGLGPDGKMLQAVAVDFSPASLFFRSTIVGGSGYYSPRDPHNDLEMTNYWKRVLARTTVSLASTDKDDNGAARMAWGVRFGLIDFGDPGLYANEVAKCLRTTPMPDIPAGRGLDPTPRDAAIDACDVTKNRAHALWAKPAVYAGYGRSWYSQTGTITDRASDAKAWWLSGSLGLAGPAEKETAASELSKLRLLLQMQVGRRMNDRVTDPGNPANLFRSDSREAVVRLKFGRSIWHGFVDVGRSRNKLQGAVTESVRRTAYGAEYKLDVAQDMWLKLANVRERGFADGKDRSSTSVGLKIGVPFLAMPGLGK